MFTYESKAEFRLSAVALETNLTNKIYTESHLKSRVEK